MRTLFRLTGTDHCGRQVVKHFATEEEAVAAQQVATGTVMRRVTAPDLPESSSRRFFDFDAPARFSRARSRF